MNALGNQIQHSLQQVASERAARAADPALDRRVAALKAYQQQRFAQTYADLLSSPRYERAARFFLDELYGPADFSQRDAEFARIVPALVRLFPRELVSTVMALAQLHALSEHLDTGMARLIADGNVSDESYRRAWCQFGRADDRERQVDLTLTVGSALDRYTRNALLRHSLRLMRTPAQAAGLGGLQRLLETGFETFRAMRGAQEFLALVAGRERELAARLFAA